MGDASAPSTPRGETASRRGSSASAKSKTSSAEAKELSKQKYDSPFDASLVAARKRSQQERLWEIFTAYALQISSEDPTRIRIVNVVKLLQDCGIIDGNNTEEAKMIEKEVAIVCEAFLKAHPTDRDSSKKLDFTAFLALLLHFAKMSGDRDPSRAYDSLVRTCLEKQQKSRIRVVVAQELLECKKVLAAFEDPLTKIFMFYAAQSHSKLEKIDTKMAQFCPPHMSYAEAVAFGRKYGIIAHGVLTTTEFASIYIDSLPKAPATEYDRVLTYKGFCEMLVRLSKKTCLDKTLPADRNLKGLLQVMWLALASSSPRALKITDVLKSDRVDVTKHFLIHFEKYWKKERYENYFGDRPASVRIESVMDPPSPPKPPMPRRLSLNPTPAPKAKTLPRRMSVQTTSKAT
ncbi:hypothetical protein PHYSODRAFT_322405 [Phytophthora sojae]|uniref:Uncharacterized protein n=1 Tax=Phytophthora sojae (strain P6497) TaxID=1094619 RepID=G4YIV7_PHYSP|nr:hypothetical protein PHYSODRAFT_322405 [Phytophthora sojae]EGZ28780.1 hypothetical protein PHYSODRAFT_322405 [Phytophthora sojae]|eukprot:XP_009516055.1 hypothetical protein PHYSODRAFT_322405 [Phytophthora sojae]